MDFEIPWGVLLLVFNSILNICNLRKLEMLKMRNHMYENSLLSNLWPPQCFHMSSVLKGNDSTDATNLFSTF